jgi:hypothetical protein
VYSRVDDDSGINGDLRNFPDDELDDWFFDGLSEDDEVRSVVPGPTPTEFLDNA